MKQKNIGAPINQDEINLYLKDIRKIKVMTPEREKLLAQRMVSGNLDEKQKKEIKKELLDK